MAKLSVREDVDVFGAPGSKQTHTVVSPSLQNLPFSLSPASLFSSTTSSAFSRISSSLGAAVVVVVVVNAPLPSPWPPTGRLANKFDLRTGGANSSCDHADDKSISKAKTKHIL